jgi:hypothetical protein
MVLPLPNREALVDRHHHAKALAGGIGRRRRHSIGKLEAAREDPSTSLPKGELRPDIIDEPTGVEALAREDIDPNVAMFRESMEGNVTLGDQDEAGNPPVLGFLANVPADMGRRDLRHAYLLWIAV